MRAREETLSLRNFHQPISFIVCRAIVYVMYIYMEVHELAIIYPSSYIPTANIIPRDPKSFFVNIVLLFANFASAPS